MIKFKTLSIRNFLSYGNIPIVLDLDTVGTTLIIGEDLDNTASGTGGNGCGKSSWVNALIYGLYGKPLSNISMDNLINNINKKNMRVEVEFEKDNKIITIRRARKEKGNGNYAKIFVRPLNTELDESIHEETPDSISNINDYIIGYLGIQYELFIRIVTFTATHTPFLDLTLRQQSDIMEELFSLTQLSVKADLLKQKIKDSKQSLEIKIIHNEQLVKENERHNKQLESAENRVNDWEIDRDETIVIVKNNLIKHEAIPVKKQEELYKEIDKIKSNIVIEKEKQSKIESVITTIGAEYTVITSKIKQIEEEKNKILNWKDENTQKIKRYKDKADKLPVYNLIENQIVLHDTLKKITNDLGEFVATESSSNAKIEKYTDDINNLTNELVHLEDAKCPYCLQQYADATIKVKECKDTIKKYTVNKNAVVDLLKDINIEIKEHEDNINKISNDIKYSIDEITDYEQLRNDYVKKLEDLMNEECPYGDKTTTGDMVKVVAELKDEALKLKKDIDNKATLLLEADKSVSNSETDLSKCQNAITIPTLDKLYEIKNEIKQYKNKIKELQDAVNPYNEPLKELQNITLEKVDMKSINKLDELITHQNYLIKLLTKKDSFIRKTLLNKNLSFLNKRLQHYLSALGLPHKVEFTQEMTANISQFGRQLDFGNLSSGQKARVNIGLSFSFRDVLQKSNDRINVCMLDEVLDVGLDSVGVQNAARMLKRKAYDENLALYIISHRDEVSNIFDQKMIIQMENGFSSIK